MLTLIILILCTFIVVALSPRILSAMLGKGTANSATIIYWAAAITTIIAIKFILP